MNGPDEGVGDGRPFRHMGDKRIDLLLGRVALHVHLHAHISEADGFVAQITSAPNTSDVEVALELKLELLYRPAAMNRIRVQAHSKAGTKRRKRGLRRIRCGIVPKQRWRLIHDIGRQISDIVEVTK